MCRPSVAGVELQALALGWRWDLGIRSKARVFQRIQPVPLSNAISRHWWGVFSATGSISP